MPAPRVTIGLPVHNGEAFLREALDTLLGQSFTDFELVVSENASTDRTPEILEEYARRDTRVRIEPTGKLLGAAENFARVLTLTRGEYFKWHAADDELEGSFLARAVEILDRAPDVGCVASRVLLIDAQGRPTAEHEHRFDPDADHPDRVARFVNFMRADTKRHGAHEMFALFRRSMLEKLPACVGFARADSVYLARAALLGRYRRIEEPLFRNRDHTGRETQHQPGRGANPRTRLAPYIGFGPVPPAEWWNPAYKNKINFPEWRLILEYARSRRIARLSAGESVRFSYAIARFALRNAHKLARDVVIAAEHVLLGMPKA